MASKES
jgi:hypothetical protein